jgi:hypothetical protein
VIGRDTSCNTFSKEQADIIKQQKDYDYTVQNVPVKTLDDVLSEQNITQFDILNIDVEGLDLEILQQIDFNRFQPRVIAIEDLNLDLHNALSSPIVTYMQNRGYLFHSKSYMTLIFILPLTETEKNLWRISCNNTNRIITALNKVG